MEDTDVVTVSSTRLKALEALEASLPALLETASTNAKASVRAERLRQLEEYNRAHPEAQNKRALKYYDTHKTEISIKRKAAYRAKKAAKAEGAL